MSLEDRLRRALRREEPGEDFAASVLARLDAPRARRSPVRWQAPRWALAASLVVVVFLGAATGLTVQQQRERMRQEAAGRQLAFALELTSRQLENIHQHIDRRTEESGS